MTIDIEELAKAAEALAKLDLGAIEYAKKVQEVIMNAKHAMLSLEDVASYTNSSMTTVKMWRDTGILPFMRTGRSYMCTQEAFEAFKQRFAGVDVSNKLSVIQAIKNGV
ncbi:helix-turn-helix domain-containing protein [uncultured Dubosiella sp.]|uniref:helix-turn-helix domain-containing protein n=1 Tax=uncultured Dubosiella sp. TaxID=1937011 RepID=UPI0027321FF9|nr:helix-turn-helix domain-containing protein [uncultured Dubosiella sp.]